MIVNLTSNQIRYYRASGPYYNFRAADGTAGGQYLRKGELWGHLTQEMEQDLDLDNIVLLVIVEDGVAQYDGGVTPDSLTPDDNDDIGDKSTDTEAGPGINMVIADHSTLLDQLTPRGVRQQRRWAARDGGQGDNGVNDNAEDVGYMDDDYEDQESVFGDIEAEFVLQRMGEKFTSVHKNHSVQGELVDVRLSQSLDFEIPRTSALAIHVEQFEDFPSAASFPTEDVTVPGYNYHTVRRRMISLSSPELCDERGSQPALESWYNRLWRWGREFRRRRM